MRVDAAAAVAEHGEALAEALGLAAVPGALAEEATAEARARTERAPRPTCLSRLMDE